MLAETVIALQARAPAANRQRAWRLEAGRDLFGAWTIEVQFGRIGRVGRTLQRSFAAEAELRAFVRSRLRRRATAPARIGVAYRCVAADAASAALLAECGIERNGVTSS
jgi:predicted DNA-binding WGR domain protein